MLMCLRCEKPRKMTTYVVLDDIDNPQGPYCLSCAFVIAEEFNLKHGISTKNIQIVRPEDLLP